MGTDLGPLDELRPLLYQGLPGLVRWMGLAGKDEVFGTYDIKKIEMRAFSDMNNYDDVLVNYYPETGQIIDRSHHSTGTG